MCLGSNGRSRASSIFSDAMRQNGLRNPGSKSLRVPWVRGVCAEVFENNTAVFCFFLRQRAAISTRNSNTCSTLSRNEAPVPSSLSTKEAIQTAACMSELVGALISRIDPSHPREGSVLDHGSLRCTRQVSCTVPPDSSPICLLPGLVEVVSGRGSASGGFSGYLRLVTMLCSRWQADMYTQTEREGGREGGRARPVGGRGASGLGRGGGCLHTSMLHCHHGCSHGLGFLHDGLSRSSRSSDAIDVRIGTQLSLTGPCVRHLTSIRYRKMVQTSRRLLIKRNQFAGRRSSHHSGLFPSSSEIVCVLVPILPPQAMATNPKKCGRMVRFAPICQK